MGKQIVCMWDDEVAEVFELFGRERTAKFFEALRYRQQLYKKDGKEQFFPYKAKDIHRNTGVGYKPQQRARKVLEATGWIEVKKHATAKENSVLHYRITDQAKELIKDIRRKRNMSAMRRKSVKGFSLNYNKGV